MAIRSSANCSSQADMPLDGILLAEELLDLAERAQAYTNAAGVLIALLRDGELLVRTSTGTAPEVGTVIPVDDPFIVECLQRRKSVTCCDVDSDSRVRPLFRAGKTRSLIAIPIPGQPSQRGVMVVISVTPNAFQPTHSAILTTLADIVSSKLAAREDLPEVEVEIEEAPVKEAATDPMPKLVAAETPAMATHPATAAPPLTPSPPTGAVVRSPVSAGTAEAQSTPPATLMEAMETAPPALAVKSAKLREPAAEPVMTAAPVEKPQTAAVPSVLLKHGPLPLVEDKKPDRDPGLLSTSEDPSRFQTPRAFRANTVATARPELARTTAKPAAPISSTTTSATPVMVRTKAAAPVITPPKPAAPVVLPATKTETPVAYAAKALETPAPAVTPAIAAWETPPPERGMGRFLAPVLAVAAVLVIGALVWMRYSSKPEFRPAQIAVQPIAAQPIAAPVPEPVSAAAVTPSAAVGVAKIQQVAKVEPLAKVDAVSKVDEGAQAKPAKAAEFQAPPVQAKHEPARVIEIAKAQPRSDLKMEADMSAPKLALASADSTVATLSKVAAKIPAPPTSELVPAALISRTAPVYPSAARQLGITGVVEMNVIIATDGSVRDVKVVSGASQLRSAASDAVRRWRYTPAMLSGKPVESSAHVQVRFMR